MGVLVPVGRGVRSVWLLEFIAAAFRRARADCMQALSGGFKTLRLKASRQRVINKEEYPFLCRTERGPSWKRSGKTFGMGGGSCNEILDSPWSLR